MSDTLILSSAIITMGSTVASSMLPRKVNRSPNGMECVAGDLPSFRMLSGQVLLYAGLGVVAQASSKLAGGFALAIGATAFTYYALPILDDVFVKGGLCKPGTRDKATPLASPLNPVVPPRTTTTPVPGTWENVPGYPGKI